LKEVLLLGVQTTARNILSTVSHIVAEGGPTRSIAAMVDVLASWRTGERTITRPSPIQATRSAVEAATTGRKQAWEIIKSGVPDNELERLANAREIATHSVIGNRILNSVFRFMSAQDRIMKVYAFNEALQDRARAEALSEKRAGRIGAESVEGLAKDIVRDAKEGRREDLIANSWADAEFATFNNENKLGKNLQRIKSEASPGGKFVLDQGLLFVSVPWNVIRRVMDGMGLGFTVEATKAAARAIQGKAFPTPESQRRFAQAAGRLGTGSAVMLLGAFLGGSGYVTGYNEEGDKPEASILIGGRWYKIGWVPPFGPLLALGATLRKEMSRELEQGESRTMRIAGATAEALLPQHPMARPIMDTVEPVAEALQKRSFKPLEKTAEALAARVVPAISGEIARATDNRERDTHGAWDAFKSKVPGLRNTLPIKRDGLGREVERAGAPGALGMIDVFKSVPEVSDPILKEFQTAGLSLKPIQQAQGESDSHFQTRANGIRKLMDERLSALIESPAYKELSPFLRSVMLQKTRQAAKLDYREQAKGAKIPSVEAAAWNIEVDVARESAKEELRNNSDYKDLRPADRDSVEQRLSALFRSAKAKRLSDVTSARIELRVIVRGLKMSVRDIIRDVKDKRKYETR
jgi:hypothetical protein